MTLVQLSNFTNVTNVTNFTNFTNFIRDNNVDGGRKLVAFPPLTALTPGITGFADVSDVSATQ